MGCPITYIKNAKLCGSLFSPDAKDTAGLVCGVDSQFFVDHDEPSEALARISQRGEWPLGGNLPDGHEFLLLFDKPR